jgi:hypothetical protein
MLIGLGMLGCAGFVVASGCSDDETSDTPTGTVVTNTGSGTGSGAGTSTGSGSGAGTSTGTAVGGGGTGGGATGGGATGGGATGGGATGGGATGGNGQGGGGGQACLTCSQVWPAGDDNDLCAASQTLFDTAQNCVCTTGCSTQCANLVPCGGGQQNINGPCATCVNSTCANDVGPCVGDT